MTSSFPKMGDAFPNMSDINNMLRDGACVTEDGFPNINSVSVPLAGVLKKSKARKKDSHVAARQISAAYDEHALIINALKKELENSKGREKALVDQFASKFKELQMQLKNSVPASDQRAHLKSSDADTSLNLDELPMDEMADTARMLKSAKMMDQFEQKRALEELKKETDSQMKELRAKSQKQLGKIQQSLKDKVAEIEGLKKKYESLTNERNDFKKKLEESMSSPASLRYSSKTVATGGLSESYPDPGDEIFVTPMKDSPDSMKNFTPMHRLRSGKENKLRNSTPPTQPLSMMHGMNNSTMSASPNAKENSPGPTSRLDALFQKVTDPNLNSLHNILLAVENEVTSNDKGSSEQIPKLSESEQEFVKRMKTIISDSQKEHEEMLQSLNVELEETNNVLEESELKSSESWKKVRDIEEENQSLRKSLSLANASVKNKNNLEGMLRMVAVDQKSGLKEHTALKEKMRKIEMERDELISEQREAQIENEQAIAALRRVMADVTAEKENTVKEMLAKVNEISTENRMLKKKLDPSFEPSTDTTVTIDKNELAKLRQDALRCSELESELETRKVEDVQDLESDLADARNLIRDLEEQVKNKSAVADEMVELQMSELKDENFVLLGKAKELDEKLEENRALVDKATDLEEHTSKLRDEAAQKQKGSDQLVSQLKNELKEKQEEIHQIEKTCDDEKTKNSSLLNDNESLGEQKALIESELETMRLRVNAAEEVLKTTKAVHVRENQLEDELSEAQELLDNALSDKKGLKDILDSLRKEMKQKDLKLQNLQNEILEMKEEKLSLTSKTREAETAYEQSNRIMQLMQETTGTEETASKAVLDLKHQLQEQQDLHSKLRYCCDDFGATMIDKLDRKVNTTLCLLDTGILGIRGVESLSHLDFSGEASAKEQILESSLNIQRSENQRICKNIEELRVEKEQETAMLGIQLSQLHANYDQNVTLLKRNESELKVLQSRLNGYISDGYSDTDDDEVLSPMARHSTAFPKPNGTDNSKKLLTELQYGKERAEREAKENAESLSNAKMIISSLEQSNQAVVANLKDRLSDSNAAIVSLLDQSKRYEEEAKQLKAKNLQLSKAQNEKEMSKNRSNEEDKKALSIENSAEIKETEN